MGRRLFSSAQRVNVERKRLDGDRDGVGRLPQPAEVDVVEVVQPDTVEDQQVAGDAALPPKQLLEGQRDVRVDHEVQRQPPPQPLPRLWRSQPAPPIAPAPSKRHADPVQEIDFRWSTTAVGAAARNRSSAGRGRRTLPNCGLTSPHA